MIPYPESVVGVVVMVLHAWVCAEGGNVEGFPVMSTHADEPLAILAGPCAILSTFRSEDVKAQISRRRINPDNVRCREGKSKGSREGIIVYNR